MNMTKEDTAFHMKISKVIANNDVHLMALGWLRYETIRRIRPDQFAQLYKKSLQTNIQFDTLIDQLISQQP